MAGRITVIGAFLFAIFFSQIEKANGLPSGPSTDTFKTSSVLRVAVVGDTGIGKRAYHPGFLAVQKAMRDMLPEVLLHLGDFVYQPEFLPDRCKPEHIREIKETLVAPYPFRLFVPGDNDLPPHKSKPKASGCWDLIDPLDTTFDEYPSANTGPGPFEGTRVIGNTFFAILNNYPWKDPTAWLGPRIEEARRKGYWIILSVHEPAVTTAWFLDKRDAELKQINALNPDLVFSGNQHSYERFHAMVPVEEGKFGVMKSESGNYRKGDGVIHIVSGGGGATFKPFADMQNFQKRTAPDDVFQALASRALMNHFITLDISKESLKGTVWRVCTEDDPDDEWNPRWKAHKKFWNSIPLECDGKSPGTSVYETFNLHKD